MWMLCAKLAALVQFNHIAIRITHEGPLRFGPEADGATTQWDASGLKPLLRSYDVRAQECEVCDSLVLLRGVTTCHHI
jgi:hypothetical protein